MTLAYIILASLAGGVLSAVLAGLVASRVAPRLIPVIVSYAVGALLGVVFLDLLPHIFESGQDRHHAAGWILAGILAFFVMEKMVLWRHDHDHAGAAQAAIAGANGQHRHDHTHNAADHDHGRPSSAWTIIVGDAFHNFTDGFAIAAAFMADTRLGIVTSLAIVAHELPQELGDFLVLVHSGFSRGRAMFWNIMSSIATVLGALLAYFTLQAFSTMSTVFLCIAASSMIYVAIADLIPGLHRKSAIRDSLTQFALIALGVGSIVVVQTLISH